MPGNVIFHIFGSTCLVALYIYIVTHLYSNYITYIIIYIINTENCFNFGQPSWQAFKDCHIFNCVCTYINMMVLDTYQYGACGTSINMVN